MKWTRLSDDEIDELLASYRSERKQLNFKLGLVQKTIKDLKGIRVRKVELAHEREENKANAPSRYKRKPGRRKKRTVVGGYRMNPWDQFVIDAIEAKGQLMTKAELIAASKVWVKANNIKAKAADLEIKITRSLNKLGGKRNDVGKHRSGVGRGLHYGVGEWFFANTGKLKAVFNDKVPAFEPKKKKRTAKKK